MLSQKHSGKVIVPWKYSEEWASVYDKAYSEDLQTRQEALGQLRIWKLRTPLLPAGIEGTLIILDALSSDKSKLTGEQIKQIYSLALMRFVNICAPSNDRTNTFFQTATRHGLPSWVVNLRHDIAHDHRLPARLLLEKSLEFCLNWLREKYWIKQLDSMNNYVINSNVRDEKLEKVLSVYLQLIYNRTTKKKMISPSLKKELNSFLPYLLKSKKEKLVPTLETMLGTAIRDNKSETNLEDVFSNMVIERFLLFAPCYKIADCNRIISDVRNGWNDFLNILYESGHLITLAKQLYLVILCPNSDSIKKDTASAWIMEIIIGLIRVKSSKDPTNINSCYTQELDVRTGSIVLKSTLEHNGDHEECLVLNTNIPLPVSEMLSFQTLVLESPNLYVMSFLESLLNLNNCPSNFVEDVNELMNITLSGNAISNNTTIYTVNDLKGLFDNNSMDTEECTPTLDDALNGGNGRWTFKDISTYRGCPLGVLPGIR